MEFHLWPFVKTKQNNDRRADSRSLSFYILWFKKMTLFFILVVIYFLLRFLWIVFESVRVSSLFQLKWFVSFYVAQNDNVKSLFVFLKSHYSEGKVTKTQDTGKKPLA